jgi:hypothetical protein
MADMLLEEKAARTISTRTVESLVVMVGMLEALAQVAKVMEEEEAMAIQVTDFAAPMAAQEVLP